MGNTAEGTRKKAKINIATKVKAEENPTFVTIFGHDIEINKMSYYHFEDIQAHPYVALGAAVSTALTTIAIGEALVKFCYKVPSYISPQIPEQVPTYTVPIAFGAGALITGLGGLYYNNKDQIDSNVSYGLNFISEYISDYNVFALKAGIPALSAKFHDLYDCVVNLVGQTQEDVI